MLLKSHYAFKAFPSVYQYFIISLIQNECINVKYHEVPFFNVTLFCEHILPSPFNVVNTKIISLRSMKLIFKSQWFNFDSILISFPEELKSL